MKSEERNSLSEEILISEVVRLRNKMPVLGGRKLYSLVKQRIPDFSCPGRDRFFKMLSDNNLLIRKKRSHKPITTMSWHHFHKFRNLWHGNIPTAPNRVWVADITYIRTSFETFLYLSLLTDVYSHKIVGWHLSESLDMKGPIFALQMALRQLPPEHRLMHHSDRGVQYCSKPYVSLLQSKGIQISMTESGDPKENSIAERVNGILKEEWLNRENIESLEDGEEKVARTIELYNRERPHLSNDYLTPEQAHQQNGKLKRQWKTYYKKKEDIDHIMREDVTLQQKPWVDLGCTPGQPKVGLEPKF